MISNFFTVKMDCSILKKQIQNEAMFFMYGGLPENFPARAEYLERAAVFYRHRATESFMRMAHICFQGG